MNIEVNKLSNIPFDKFFYDERCFFEKNHVLYELTGGKIIDFYTHDQYFIIEGVNNNLIWIRDKQKLNCINIETKVVMNIPLFFENSIQIKNIREDFLIIRSSTSTEKWVVNKINFSGEKEWEIDHNTPFRSIQVNKNLVLLSYEQKSIECFSTANGRMVWQLLFKDILDLENISLGNDIIENAGIVYFTLHGEGLHTCFGVEATSGKVVKRFEDMIGDLFLKNEVIYFLHPDKIQKLNTKTDNIEEWEIENIMNEEDLGNLRSPVWYIYDDYIYFSQSAGADIYSGTQGAYYGILDTTHKKLVHKNQLSAEHGIIGDIKVTQNYIYVHTQDQTLLVLKKDYPVR